MTLYEQLVAKARACHLPATATPFQRFVALWDLYTFLDETEGIELYVSTGNQLQEVQNQLSETEKQSLRAQYGVCFPEDDRPIDHLAPSDEDE